jgi:hypothetical protein
MQIAKQTDYLIWRGMDINEMHTSHVFNTFKMLYNHMAEGVGFPTYRMTRRYNDIRNLWINNPNYMLDLLKVFAREVVKRKDLSQYHSTTFERIKYTLDGGLHRQIEDILKEHGVEYEVNRDPFIKLLKGVTNGN